MKLQVLQDDWGHHGEQSPTSFFLTFAKERARIRDKLEKEGIVDPPIQEVRDDIGTGLQQEELAKHAEQYHLQGKTMNNESCTCQPGTLHEPMMKGGTASPELRKETEGAWADAMNFLGSDFRKGNAKANSIMDPLFHKFEVSASKFDSLLKELEEKASVTNAAAVAMKQTFQKVQRAHEAGRCHKVTKVAEDDDELAVPMCKQQLDQAASEFDSRRDAAQPKCKVGAVALDALREFAMPRPERLVEAAAVAATCRGSTERRSRRCDGVRERTRSFL
eukprot:TRINITY_DN47120_c0_g1_i1.p1 TRINITY_DN47120_c0_g1~~TRINITY_DN47120_c0_g1_i1.p1  ORF type:complete len:299 (+),score=72.08 TRINITY_DN47120_c0_g1_i1:69-899(+)